MLVLSANTQRTRYIVRVYNRSPIQLLKLKESGVLYTALGFRISLFSIFNFYHSSHTLIQLDLQGLCEWRDIVARAEDESTGYILPNKSVLEIGN